MRENQRDEHACARPGHGQGRRSARCVDQRGTNQRIQLSNSASALECPYAIT
jgi:hypothetical protein